MGKLIKLMVVAGLVVVAIALYVLWQDDEIVPDILPRSTKIVAFGDSLVEGAGATPGNDFVSVVGRNVGIQIVNKGHRGDTTATGLGRIDEVLAEKPGIVILLLGGNDALRRVPKETTFKNLEAIIQRLQGGGAVVILLGVRGNIFGDSYEKDYRNLAVTYNTGYVSNVLSGLITNPKYMYDGIHPNDTGYAIIAGRVTSVLKKVLGR